MIHASSSYASCGECEVACSRQRVRVQGDKWVGAPGLPKGVLEAKKAGEIVNIGD